MWIEAFKLDSQTGELTIVHPLDVDSASETGDSSSHLLKIAAYKAERECEPFDQTADLKRYKTHSLPTSWMFKICAKFFF